MKKALTLFALLFIQIQLFGQISPAPISENNYHVFGMVPLSEVSQFPAHELTQKIQAYVLDGRIKAFADMGMQQQLEAGDVLSSKFLSGNHAMSEENLNERDQLAAEGFVVVKVINRYTYNQHHEPVYVEPLALSVFLPSHHQANKFDDHYMTFSLPLDCETFLGQLNLPKGSWEVNLSLLKTSKIIIDLPEVREQLTIYAQR